MKIRNNNPGYGDAGPFEAASFEALADEMTSLFHDWANDHLTEELDRGFEVHDEAAYIAERIAEMRAELIAGLEEVPS